MVSEPYSDPSWPENRWAPGRLELVRRLINTLDRQHEHDRIEEPSGASDWLKSEGFSPDSLIGARGVRSLIDFREMARAAATADDMLTHEGLEWLFDVTVETAVRFTVVDGLPHLEGASEDPADRYIDTLTLVIGESLRDGTWRRFKVCANPDCQWAFYDHSKNSSGRWCSMETCGARSKISTFRAKEG